MRPRLRPLRSCHSGQASSDYVGLLAVVAAVAGAAATAVEPPPLAADVVAAVRHGICRVAGGVCSAEEARRAGLAPCVVHVRSESDAVGAVIAVVRLKHGDTAIVERRSDGTATVAFLDENAVGVQTGVGLQASAIGASGSATAGGGLAFNTGRSYEFASWPAARAFLATYAGEESLGGEARNLGRRVSPLHEPRRLPPADSSSFETGTWAELDSNLAASLPMAGARLNGDAAARLARVLGRRQAGARTTWYLRVDADVAARLGLVVGALGGSGSGSAVLEVTTERERMVSAAVTATGGVTGRVSLYGQTADLRLLADRLKRASAGGGGAGESGLTVEASVSLDLTVPENHAALVDALEILRLGAPPGEWPERVGRLGERLNSHGRVDIATYRSSSAVREHAAQLSAGLGVGVDHVRTRRTRELIGAWTAQGGGLREREDCATA